MVDRTAELIRRTPSHLAELYLTNRLAQGLADGFAVLSIVYGLDKLFGCPIGWRAAYLFPLYFAARSGQRIASAALVVAGVLAAQSNEAKAGYGDALLKLVLFGAVAYGIDRILCQIDRVRIHASHDPLTGAVNRRALEAHADRMITKATVQDSRFSLVMIDCDKFKRLNDDYGHAVGDLILVALVKQLRKCVKGADIIGRTGGDEFVVLLPGRSRREAEDILCRASDCFSDATLALGYRSAISFGIAEIGVEASDYKSLMKLADQDMYCRKSMKADVPELVVVRA